MGSKVGLIVMMEATTTYVALAPGVRCSILSNFCAAVSECMSS